MTLGSLFAIFEPWIWRRLGPVPACLLFQGNPQNRTCLKGPTFGFFSALSSFFAKLFMSPKGPPSSFLNFATECMLINPKGSFFERKKFKNFKFFSKKNVLRFLSPRNSADFRRSRLVFFRQAKELTLYVPLLCTVHFYH